MSSSAAVTVRMPGAFWSWFSGSSVGQGQTDGWGVGGEVVWMSVQDARAVNVGKGYFLPLRFDADEDGRAGLRVLLEYAEACVDLNTMGGAEVDKSELRAARRVVARCREALREVDDQLASTR